MKLKKIYNLKKNLRILIVGGSQGAEIFDNKLKDSIINLSKKFSIKIIQQTNKKIFLI